VKLSAKTDVTLHSPYTTIYTDISAFFTKIYLTKWLKEHNFFKSMHYYIYEKILVTYVMYVILYNEIHILCTIM